MHLARPFMIASLAAFTAGACGRDDSDIVRGRGLTVAALSADAQAHVYEAALRSAFDLTDESLSLLLDTRELPRTAGLAPDGHVSDAVTAELRRRGAVKGTCQPSLSGTRGTARCTAAMPGYVVRFSPVFMIRPDSAQVYVFAQKYDTPASGNSEKLVFERAYQVVRRGDAWTAVREGRVPKEVREGPAKPPV